MFSTAVNPATVDGTADAQARLPCSPHCSPPRRCTACVSTRQMVAQNEDNLAAAGFLVRPANTPERQAMLNKLPPHRFVKRIRDDTVHYVYADPLVCDCLYVGNQQAYSRYQRYLQQKQLADEQETTAQMYSDPLWNWGAWGPWGPVYGRVFWRRIWLVSAKGLGPRIGSPRISE